MLYKTSSTNFVEMFKMISLSMKTNFLIFSHYKTLVIILDDIQDLKTYEPHLGQNTFASGF